MDKQYVTKKKLSMNKIEKLPNQCAFFVKAKQRYCSREKVETYEYCYTHAHLDTNYHGPKRITCPINPEHIIYEKDLNYHLKVCNTVKAMEKQQNEIYYEKDINLGCCTSHSTPKAKETTSQDKKKKMSKELLDMLNKMSEEELQALIDKINTIYEKLFPSSIASHCIQSIHCEQFVKEEEISKIKHAQQQSAIIAHIEHEKCFSPKYTYFEFGSGKAFLSLMLKRALAISNNVKQTFDEPYSTDKPEFYLIDRDSSRRKADNLLRAVSKFGILNTSDKSIQQKVRDLDFSTQSIQRITLDIKDLNLKKVPLIEHVEQGVVISKHLCGVATDLTLRCITQSSNLQPDSHTLVCPFKGIFVALCCHHLCSWQSYVNQNFFSEIGFNGEQDFDKVRRLCSWALCYLDAEGNVVEKTSGVETNNLNALLNKLSYGQKTEIGFRCKRIIDAGRVDYLKHLPFFDQVKLVQYTEKSFSPENVMLICTTKN